jgi:hypothetical protein
MWMHLNFYSFSDEAIHVAGYSREYFRVLQSDVVVMIENVFSYCRFFGSQTPENYPNEIELRLKHSENLKSRIIKKMSD